MQKKLDGGALCHFQVTLVLQYSICLCLGWLSLKANRGKFWGTKEEPAHRVESCFSPSYSQIEASLCSPASDALNWGRDLWHQCLLSVALQWMRIWILGQFRAQSGPEVHAVQQGKESLRQLTECERKERSSWMNEADDIFRSPNSFFF